MPNERILKLYSAVDNVPKEIDTSNPPSVIKCEIDGENPFELGMPVAASRFVYVGNELVFGVLPEAYDVKFEAAVFYTSSGKLHRIMKTLQLFIGFK